MKFVLLLLFVFITHTVLFIASILYSGTSTDDLKKALYQSGVYTQLSTYLAQEGNYSTPENQQISTLVSNRFTPEYIRTKTESALDSSIAWIKGDSASPPVVDFRELKQDMFEQNRDLLFTLQTLPQRTEKNREGLTEEQYAELRDQATKISTFVREDFTVQLEPYLKGFKDIYNALRFAAPVLVLLLICILLGLGKLAHVWPSRFKWIGATFLTTALVGYGIIYFNTWISSIASQMYTIDQSGYSALFAPIVIAIMKYYVAMYITTQGIANIFLLMATAVCIVGAIITRKQA